MLPEVAVIVTDPLAIPLAIPPEVMVTSFVSEELHCTEPVTSLLLPSENEPVAENCSVAPGAIDTAAGETCRAVSVGGTGVGVGDGEGVGAGVGVGTKPLDGVPPPPPPQPAKTIRPNKTSVVNIDLTFTPASEPGQGYGQKRNFSGGNSRGDLLSDTQQVNMSMHHRTCTIGGL